MISNVLPSLKKKPVFCAKKKSLHLPLHGDMVGSPRGGNAGGGQSTPIVFYIFLTFFFYPKKHPPPFAGRLGSPRGGGAGAKRRHAAKETSIRAKETY